MIGLRVPCVSSIFPCVSSIMFLNQKQLWTYLLNSYLSGSEPSFIIIKLFYDYPIILLLSNFFFTIGHINLLIKFFRDNLYAKV